MIEAADVEVAFKRGWRKHRRLKALDGFSLTIEKGDVFAILGPNGSGKSTAMHTFLGLIRPDRGTVRLFGERPKPGAAMYERIAYLPEEPHYHLYLTVEEAVRYYVSLYRERCPESRIQAVIDEVGLTAYKDLLLRKCSKGMKQKVGIASCLVKRPDVLFLDEPMRGLDPGTVKQFRDLLLEMNGQGTTVLINSHILSEVEAVCTKAAIMQKGRVARQDSIDNLVRKDIEHYVIEADATDSLPDFFKLRERREGRVIGSVAASQMAELFTLADQARIKIHSCTLRHSTLEEAFFAALEDKS